MTSSTESQGLPPLPRALELLTQQWNRDASSKLDDQELDLEAYFEEAADLLFPDHILSDPSQSIRRSYLSPLNIRVDNFNQLMMGRLPGTAGRFFAIIPLRSPTLSLTHTLFFRDLSQLRFGEGDQRYSAPSPTRPPRRISCLAIRARCPSA